jgi:hypothetical protein
MGKEYFKSSGLVAMNITICYEKINCDSVSIVASIVLENTVLFTNTFCASLTESINLYYDWPFNKTCHLDISTDSNQPIVITSIIFDNFWNLKSFVGTNNKLSADMPLRYDIIRPIARMVFRYE